MSCLFSQQPQNSAIIVLIHRGSQRAGAGRCKTDGSGYAINTAASDGSLTETQSHSGTETFKASVIWREERQRLKGEDSSWLQNAAATGNTTGEEIGHETDEPEKKTTLPFSTSTAATHHHVLLLQRSQQTAQTLSVSLFLLSALGKESPWVSVSCTLAFFICLYCKISRTICCTIFWCAFQIPSFHFDDGPEWWSCLFRPMAGLSLLTKTKSKTTINQSINKSIINKNHYLKYNKCVNTFV